MNSEQRTVNSGSDREFPPRYIYEPIQRKPVSDRQWPPLRARESYVEKRHQVRRAADRKFRFVLISAMAMTFLTGFSLGFYWAAKDAAEIVLGAK